MNLLEEAFRSVGDVWVVWLGCAALFGAKLYRASRRLSYRRLLAFAKDERGATYALPYMLTFPIYMLVMCLMVQSTMILMVKMVSMRAAYATARSAVVWRSAHPRDQKAAGDRAVERAHFAAAIAMAPVASSQKRHMTNPLLESGIFHKPTDLNWHYLREKIYREAATPFSHTYERIAKDNVRRDNQRPNPYIRRPDGIAPRSYLRQKMKYAAWATRVEVDTDPKYNEWNHPYTIELVYLMPMHIPGAGRILGSFHQRGQFHSRLIVTKASMPMETPKSSDRLLGIGYDPGMLR